jgi:glycosyltransferase involved in cell wall biosynthesis
MVVLAASRCAQLERITPTPYESTRTDHDLAPRPTACTGRAWFSMRRREQRRRRCPLRTCATRGNPRAAAPGARHRTTCSPMTHLLVFSHLRWRFVYQRPQHLLSRLAPHFPVLFVEEPVRGAGPPWLECSAPVPGVTVLRPHTPIDAAGFHDAQLPVLAALLQAHLERAAIDDLVAWFYTPMALPLLADLAPRAVIYDCMDELAAFKDAPRQMRQREAALLKTAQLVFTGGPSLYEAKRMLHPKVLCLPSAVDAAHYAPERALAHPEAMAQAQALQGAIRGPRLGFFGVIDERLDLELLASVADAERAWQLVMVGPVAKIDPASLPQRANIHWLGQQPYELLPQLAAGWDACLLPFARNAATRYVSPTKTLEYLAAGRPVVSTGLHDVKALFADVVRIADDAPAFVDALRATLAEAPNHRADRLAEMQACVWRYSWDETAAAVRRAIASLLAKAPATPHATPATIAARTSGALVKPVAAPIVAPLAARLEPQGDAPAVAPLVARLVGPLADAAGAAIAGSTPRKVAGAA